MLWKILHDKKLFDAIFHLFSFDHFWNCDNAEVDGLSIYTIYFWFPHHIGMNHLCGKQVIISKESHGKVLILLILSEALLSENSPAWQLYQVN